MDVARIDLMRKLMLNGVLPSEAAKTALTQNVLPANLAPESNSAPTLHVVSDSEDQADNVIALDSPKAIIRSLTRAASALDASGCDQIIFNSLDNHGVVWTWENVLIPVLVALGEKWEQTGEGVEQEHLIAESVTGLFRNLANSVTEPENARPVLLACAPHELHTIPMYAIAAGLAEQNIACRILGARMPAEALANAAKKIGPSAIVVWSQTQGTADITIWDSVEPMRPAPLLMSVGPGWQSDVPEGVVKSKDFTSTLIALAAASGR
jgi:methanogenic corrinoid protein MtbC1